MAAGAGIDRAEVVELLAGDKGLDDVRAGEERARSLGVSGVPFFVVNGQVALSGAQPPEVLLDFLQQGWDARPALPVVADGATCGPDGC